MLITTAEPVFLLVPGLDSDCAPPDSDLAFAAVELVSVLGVAVLEPVFGVARLDLVGPPVNSDCAGAPAAPVPLESVLVCAALDGARIDAVVRQFVAAAMPQHVRVDSVRSGWPV